METTTTTLVVLEVYDNPTQAEIAKSILDSAGIFCVLNGDNMATIYSPIAFPVRLMVRDVDAEEAKTLLANDNY
ncbi:MAG: DUF2007 domain-containing protein [Alistipes sp.]|nr:DUF2007 domain-containing protein [Alistipes sp.]